MKVPFMFSLKTDINPKKIVQDKGLAMNGEAQKFIDSEVLRLCDPYIPKDEGDLIGSGTNNTEIGSGEVRYRTPYARRWYYMPADFQGAPIRGNYWFERMKKQGGLSEIKNGVSEIIKRRSSK